MVLIIPHIAVYNTCTRDKRYGC